MSSDSNMLGLVVQVVESYVSNNNLSIDQIGSLVNSVHKSFAALGEEEVIASRPEPAVSIKKSIAPDYLVSLFDGRKMKSLKRYLRAEHDMTPDDYRAYWSLPHDYPMVCPNYATQRSEMAKAIGLGKRIGAAHTRTPAAKAARVARG